MMISCEHRLGKRATEEKRAYIESLSTREVDAREAEKGDRFGGDNGRPESYQETGGREPG
jgi:hypothetical protein